MFGSTLNQEGTIGGGHRTGAKTVLAQIIRLVEDVQMSKAPIKICGRLRNLCAQCARAVIFDRLFASGGDFVFLPFGVAVRVMRALVR